MTTAWFFTLSFLLWLAVVMVMDLRYRKVRNWIVLLGLSLGTAALFSGVQPFWVEPWSGAVGMAAAFVALLPFYALRCMGAGDVKFAAVIGLWFGLTPYLLVIWVGGSVLAGLHGVFVLFLRQARPNTQVGSLQLSAATFPVSAGPAEQVGVHVASPGASRVPRTIPYAGYMAVIALLVAWHLGPSLP